MPRWEIGIENLLILLDIDIILPPLLSAMRPILIFVLLFSFSKILLQFKLDADNFSLLKLASRAARSLMADDLKAIYL